MKKMHTECLPKCIKVITGEKEYFKDTIGQSGASIFCFDNMVLKIEHQSEETSNEAAVLQWLHGRLPVPEILCHVNENGFSYLLMSKAEGEMACHSSFITYKTELTVELLAQGIKMLQSVDIAHCPFDRRLDKQLKAAQARVEHGLCETEDAEPGTYGKGGFKNPHELLKWLMNNRPEEEPAFSHGDYCLPNVFLDNERVSSFIDFGRSGIRDIYGDIAIGYRSIKHNLSLYAPENGISAEMFFDNLNITPDMEKIKYYILLDELF